MCGSRLRSLPVDGNVLAISDVGEGYSLRKYADGYTYYDNRCSLESQRFDMVSPFEQGFAIVGKAGLVTIMDQCFRCLDRTGNFVYTKEEGNYISFDGFKKVTRSKKLGSGFIGLTDEKGETIFFNLEENKLQTFKHYNGQDKAIVSIQESIKEVEGAFFTESGWLFLDSGFYFTAADLKQLKGAVTVAALRKLLPKDRNPYTYIKRVK